MTYTPKARLPILWVFIAALLVRVLCFMELAESALFTTLLGDGRQYHAWAMVIAGGDWVGQEVFYQAPLYPYFLAAIATVFGPGVWPIKVIQAILGSASCVLVAFAGRRFFGPRAGLVAGALLALYPPAVFFDSLVQKTSLALFLICALLALVAELERGVRRRWLLAAGLVLGALALTRENALALAPVLIAWISFRFRESGRRRAVRVALFAAGLAAVLVPVGLRNLAVGGRFLVTTSQLGSNFYIGNHPDADGKYRPLRPGREDARVERRDAALLAEAEAGRTLTPAEVSRHWLGRSLAYIRSHPGHWGRLLLKKAFLVVNARELVDTESIEAYREHSRLLRALGWILHFGTIGPLAVFGVWVTRRRWRRLWILYAFALAIALSLVLFYVMARYRLQLVPVVVLFAAAGLVELHGRWRSRSPAALAPSFAILALTGIAQNWTAPVATSPRATTYYNLGVALFEEGDEARARVYLEKALALLPGVADSHYSLGRVLAAQGDAPESIRHFERALAIDTAHAGSRRELGRLLARGGRPAAALEHYRAAVALDPTDAEARFDLARLLAEQGEAAAAIEHYRTVLELEPENATAHNNLGHLLSLEGRLEPAAHHLRRAVAIDPGLAMAHNLLGNVLALTGRRLAAVEQYQEALRIAPDLGDAHFKLGLLLAETGKVVEARRHLEATARLLPDFPDAHLRLAAVLEAQGEADEAASEYRRVLELRPQDPEATRRLAALGMTR